MESQAYGIRPPPKPSKLPWVIAVVTLLGGAGAGWVAWNARGERALALEKAETMSAKAKFVESKSKDVSARLEQLEAERASLLAAKNELSKDVQVKDEELAKLKGTYDQMKERFKGELSSGDLQLTQSGGKLRVDLVDRVLFGSGDALLSKRGENVLMRLGAILATIEDKQVQVSGHTDVWPIGEKRSKEFPTNWELSVARATNVVRFLSEKANVPGERLSASGYGEFHPVASNKTAAGRARNRRIEILLVPTLAPKAIAKSKLKTEGGGKHRR